MTAGLNYDGKGMCLGSSMRGLDATLHWSQGRNYELYFRDFLQLTKSQFSSLWNGHKSSPYLSEEWVKSHYEAPRNGSKATDQHLDLAHSCGGWTSLWEGQNLLDQWDSGPNIIEYVEPERGGDSL